MSEILQSEMPPDLRAHPGLPGVRPITDETWLHVDDAYAAQVAHRRALFASHRAKVLWQDAEAGPAVSDLFEQVLEVMPSLGFVVDPQRITCPDGAVVERSSDMPMAVLGRCLQEDLCLLEKRGDEHVLTAAALCFPANWTLAQKAGKPLTLIHRTVKEYDDGLARRVQRLFDGVQVGRPIWRNNMLRYADPELHQPALENAPARFVPGADEQAYVRAERQTIVRLPKTRAVLFAIHTYVTREKLSAE